MTYKDFIDACKVESKAFAGKKKIPTTPEKQFQRGAVWAWQLLMNAKSTIYYEDILRQDVCDRYGIAEPERWMESLISETADMMADRDGMQADIIKEGRLITKVDKNMNEYKESNPLYVHLKELQRSIGMQREHLGLTSKAAKKMESPKTHDVKDDPISDFIEGIR